jgi:hypothetical protein
MDFPEYELQQKTHTFQILAEFNTIQAFVIDKNWLTINFSARPTFSKISFVPFQLAIN